MILMSWIVFSKSLTDKRGTVIVIHGIYNGMPVDGFIIDGMMFSKSDKI